jgi:hypothetical protein
MLKIGQPTLVGRRSAFFYILQEWGDFLHISIQMYSSLIKRRQFASVGGTLHYISRLRPTAFRYPVESCLRLWAQIAIPTAEAKLLNPRS